MMQPKALQDLSQGAKHRSSKCDKVSSGRGILECILEPFKRLTTKTQIVASETVPILNPAFGTAK
ncbi:hypothetical protein HAX54_030993, partial [Datura stramonium]|nr:hypothetical protein [Datura stramonium]